MKRMLVAICRWRDQRFLKRLERVLMNHKIKASPYFEGYIITTDVIMPSVGKSNKPLSRIRYDIEHPAPIIIELGDAFDTYVKEKIHETDS